MILFRIPTALQVTAENYLGATQATPPMDFLGGLEGRYENAPIRPGPSLIGEPQISPAQKAALNMEKQIHDQLLDTSAVNVLRSSIFESALLGTGIVKGPFNHYKRIHKWENGPEGRMYSPYEKTVRVLNMCLRGTSIPIHLQQR